MPQHHTTADQVVFVGEWFNSWSELQRSDFLPSLVRELRPAQHINGGLHDHMQGLNISNRPPSIFHCQVKLFHDWVSSWSPEERNKLLTLLKESDASFSETLDKSLAALDNGGDGEEAEGNKQQQQANDEAQLQGAVAAEAAAAVVVPPQVAERALPPAVAVVALDAPQQESDVDEALESAPSSTLSSPRPTEGHPDSGLDSPTGAEVGEGEDEGGHVVIMDGGEAREGGAGALQGQAAE